MRRSISVKPVTPDTWNEFVRLFEARGAPHYCWCTPHRVAAVGAERSSAQRKALMRRLTVGGTPIGVLAYDGDTPIAWCSIAPRETYVRLERSRTMPRATPLGTSTWTILCFFVVRSHRGQGVTHALLEAAVAYAREHGAKVVEGYPYDTAGISSTHRGHSRTFRSARFRLDGKRWFREL